MFDGTLTSINTILSITIGGVSLATIIGMIIAFVLQIRKMRKDNKLTKDSIETAFQKAVLPKTIKLDISKKIEEPLKDGFNNMCRTLQEALDKVAIGEKLILSVLHEFTHIHKLPETVQQEIEDYIENSKSVTLKLED